MASRPHILQRVQRIIGMKPMPAVRPFEEQGTSGTPVWGGYIQTREKNTAWAGQQRWITAADILTNVSIVAAGVHYFLNIVARPSWKVVPSSDDDPEAVELAEFVEQVINSMEDPWDKFVRRATMYRFYGFGIYEWTAKKMEDSGRVGYTNIERRPQHTIDQWVIDEKGRVQGVWQRSPQTNQLLPLPRSKIVYLVDDEFTDSPQGMGMLRHMAEPYNRLKQFLALESRVFERDLRGTPVGRAPLSEIRAAVEGSRLSEADGEKLIKGMQAFVETQVKAKNTGMLLDSAPYLSQAQDGAKVSGVPKWDMSLLTGNANGLVELHAAIDRTQREMARIGGWESLMMGGDKASGNRSLGESKERNMYLTGNAVLNNISAVATKDIIDPLWIMNAFPQDKKPWFQTEDVSFRDVGEVAQVMRDMASAGAVLDPADPAIDDVRDLLGISRSDSMTSDLDAAGLDDDDDLQVIEPEDL